MSDKQRGRGRGRGRGSQPENVYQNFSPGRAKPPTVSENVACTRQVQVSKVRHPAKDASNASVADSGCSSRPNSMFAPHPGYGTAGRPIALIVNYFVLKCNLSKVYHYHISIINPDKRRDNFKGKRHDSNGSEFGGSKIEMQQKSNVNRKDRQEVFAQLLKSDQFKKFEKFFPVYDGVNNVFTSSSLPVTKAEFKFTADFDGRKKNYLICLQKVQKDDGSNVIDLSFMKHPQQLNFEHVTSDALLALNAIMNYRRPDSLEVRVGRSFFSASQENRTSIGDGLEIWRGYIQTVHLTEDGPVMISNLSAKLFHKAGPAIDYINEVLDKGRDIRRENHLSDFDIKKISNALKGVRIRATHSRYGRKYYIHEQNTVSKLPANKTFVVIDGEQITISNYFEKKYRKLEYPHLHCLRMRTSTQTFIPFENCEIVENQPRIPNRNEEDLPPALASKMIRETAIPPVRRFREIQKHVRNVEKECGPQMSNFNISLNSEPVNVMGRVIDPPTITYLNSPGTRPNDCGAWSMKGRFIKALRVNSWAVLNFDRQCYKAQLETFSNKLQSVAYSYGLLLNKDVNIEPNSQLSSLSRARNCQLVMVVLSKYDKDLYSEIKWKADCELDLVCQCVLGDAVSKSDSRTLTNICLKINIKLGGINHRLQNDLNFGLKIFFSQPVIVFGADVVHSVKYPSIAAVVGSLDAYPSKYKVTCRVQENKKGEGKSQELIVHLQSMVATILREFKKNVEGKYPEKIIFYRDGVSEGQFKEVYRKEVPAVQKAAKEVFGFLINITFIIVQKRHHKRFLPKNPKEGVGREGNIPAGTVVDRCITYPNTFDYFLCSHEGIKGTSKPARYTVLHDDNKFSADEMQSLTYHLCHTFARCNRSVSIPAPVKYADLTAYRAKKYVDLDYVKWWKSSNRTRTYQISNEVRHAIDNMDSCKNNMFFI